MSAKSYLVKLSANDSETTKVWNTRKPLQLGHPVRWNVEKADGGLSIRSIHEKGPARFIKDSDVEKSGSIQLLVGSNGDAGFRMELKAVETIPSAFSEKADEGSRLRIFHCKGEWSIDSFELREKFIGRYEGKKIFNLMGNSTGIYSAGQALVLETLVDGILIGKEVLKKGEKRSISRSSATEVTLVYRGSDWKIGAFSPSSMDALAAPGPALDSETKLFNRVFLAAALLVLLIFGGSFLVPSPEIAKIDEPVHILLSQKKKVVKGLMSAAPRGDADAKEMSIGKNGAKAKSGKKGGMIAKNAPAKSNPPKKLAKTKKSTPPVAQAKKAKPAKSVAKAMKVEKSAPKVAAAKSSVKAKKTHVMVGAAKPVPAPKSELFKMLSSSQFVSATQSLVAGGVSSGAAASISTTEARSFGNSKGTGKGALGFAGGVSTRSAEVSGIGGGGNGDGGPGNSAGYGRGSNSKVTGEGRSLVSLDTEASEVEEGLSRDQVGRVIHAHFAEIRYCYDSAVLRDSNLDGKVTLKFSIGATGVVGRAGVGEATVSDRRLHDCIVSHLKSWRFPKPKGGVTVATSYPLMFKALTR